MATRSLLPFLLILSVLAFNFATSSNNADDLDLDEEELRLLESSDESPPSHSFPPNSDHDSDLEDFDPEEFPGFDSESYGDASPPTPAIDYKDVVVLTESNFTDFIEENQHVMVEFYAPWCGHCQALAPEYAAAATELKGEEVVLAKVDATEEEDLAQTYEVQGFPTVAFFMDGVHKPYPGARNKDAIVTWIKKKIGPAVVNVTTTKEAEKILTSQSTIVLGFLNSLVGVDSREFAAASKLEDGVNFYQTASSEVAKLFNIDPKAKCPSIVLLKKEAEKFSYFDGQFIKSAIVDFVFANKLPLVNIFTRENAPSIFENPIKKQILLFATSKGYKKVLPIFEESAKLFKGKLIFVYVEVDNEDTGKPVSDYFGVTGDGPNVLAYSGNDDPKKFMLDGEVTLDSIKTFAQGFLEDKLRPFYKSDPIPATNDGDVKIVVGNTVDEIVLDESKDVLLEIYAPWCGHCQALEPIYNKLANHLRGVESLVIAKMDGTTNEHPRAKSDGFPTILFFPAGNKSFVPITVDTDRTVVAFYKFLKNNAAIPFKLSKPITSAVKGDENTDNIKASSNSDEKSDSTSMKDEL